MLVEVSKFVTCETVLGGADKCNLKQTFSKKRIKVRYVCSVAAFTPTNPLVVKTGVLKLNNLFKLQVCKIMQNSMTGFDV